MEHMKQAKETMRKGKWEDAVPDLKEAVRLDPALVEGWLCLGMYARAKEDWPEVEKDCRQLVRLMPKDPGPRGELALALLRQGKQGRPSAWVSNRQTRC